MKYRILYIPEARYLVFTPDNKDILEKRDFTDMLNVRTQENPKNIEDVVEAMLTWSPADNFFVDNELNYPLLRSEVELIEIAD